MHLLGNLHALLDIDAVSWSIAVDSATREIIESIEWLHIEGNSGNQGGRPGGLGRSEK